MRFLEIDGLAVLVIITISWVVYKVWVNRKARKLLTKVAYFSGGPLHGTEERLAKLPGSIHHVYDKPRMVKLVEGGKPEPVQTWYEAIYTHQGNGVYEYQGSSIKPELEYDSY